MGHAKRFDEWEYGDEFVECEGLPHAVVTAMAEDSAKPTKGYLLVYSSNGTFGIFEVDKHCRCYPSVSRFIPAGVMRELLFEAFVGWELKFYDIPDELVRRNPVRKEPPRPSFDDARKPSSEAVPLPSSSESNDAPADAAVAIVPDSDVEYRRGVAELAPEIDFP